MILPGITILLKIISVVISSWVVIHLLAAFGVFIAVSYPVWWFIAPRSTICLNCQAKSKGDWCGFCNQKIEQDKHPKNIKSALYNSLLIILFSVLSMGLVYAESNFFLKSTFFSTTQNAKFVINDKGKYKINEIFPMEINVGAIESPINAVQVDLSYDPEQLEVVEVSTQNSFATVFIEKKVDNQVGYVRLTGGLPNPGYSLDRGLFGTVYFKAKNAGLATVEFLPTSMVLANDSKGTNVLNAYPTASFLIIDKDVASMELTDTSSQVHFDASVLGSASSTDQIHLYNNADFIVEDANPTNVFSSPAMQAAVPIKYRILKGWEDLNSLILTWPLNLL